MGSTESGCEGSLAQPQRFATLLYLGDSAFIEAVKSGDGSKILSPYISGVQTLAVTLAANESKHSGQPVKVRRFISGRISPCPLAVQKRKEGFVKSSSPIVAVQLYTLRNLMPRGMQYILQEVSAIGYGGIEIDSYGDLPL